MISPQEIRYFVEIARTCNLSRASERLGVTQPTLTHALNRLENELDVKLFHRNKQGVQLSAAGEKFLSSSLLLLETWDKTVTSVKNTKMKAEGRLKVGCHPSVARYTLPAFLKSLLLENEGIEISFVHDLSRYISEQVISWKLDFGIVVNPPSHPDLIIKEICKDTVGLWVKKGLENSDVLICDPELLQVRNITDKLKKKGMNFKRFINSSNLEVIATLVASGCGIGILPERVMKSNQSADVRPIMDAPIFKDRVCLIYRVGTQDSLVAKKFIKAVTDARY